MISGRGLYAAVAPLLTSPLTCDSLLCPLSMTSVVLAMPLIDDPEFAAELEAASKKVIKSSQWYWSWSMISTGALLGGVLWLAETQRWPDHLLIAAILALSVLCIVHVVTSGVRRLLLALNIVTCVTEWVGRKQLGENTD